MREFSYNLPPNARAEKATHVEQMFKIAEEAGEAIGAWTAHEGGDRVLEEVMDVYAACEGYFRKFDPLVIAHMRDKVAEKNAARGD